MNIIQEYYDKTKLMFVKEDDRVWLIDTGADSNYLFVTDKIKEKLAEVPKSGKFSCADGEIDCWNIGTTLKFDDKNFKSSFMVIEPLPQMVNMCEKIGFIPRGIIGGRFLKDNHYVVDSARMMVYMQPSLELNTYEGNKVWLKGLVSQHRNIVFMLDGEYAPVSMTFSDDGRLTAICPFGCKMLRTGDYVDSKNSAVKYIVNQIHCIIENQFYMLYISPEDAGEGETKNNEEDKNK